MVAFAREGADENALLLTAEALLEEGGLQWSGSTLADARSRNALQIVETVLRGDPKNAMANHLCLHLYDLAPDRRPALLCAQRLDAAVYPPEAEHLAHMPAHYWIETGDYAAAVRSSDRAYALLLQLEGARGESAHVEQYLKHDVAVGYNATMMLENYDAAKTWAQRMASAYGIAFDAITALRFGDYAAAYAADDPQWGDPALRGWAALLLGNRRAAAMVAATLRNAKSTGYMTPLFLARIAEAGGDPGQAKRWIAQAADEQRRDFAGELLPLVPASEALAELELRSGDRAAAESAFEQTLALYPNDPRAATALNEIQTGGASAVNAAGFP
jgi:tetratricopeptide (TPR) repeat protein